MTRPLPGYHASLQRTKRRPVNRAQDCRFLQEASLNPQKPFLQHSSTGEAVNLLSVPLTSVGGHVRQAGICRLPILLDIINLTTHKLRHSDVSPFIHQIELLDTEYAQVMAMCPTDEGISVWACLILTRIKRSKSILIVELGT